MTQKRLQVPNSSGVIAVPEGFEKLKLAPGYLVQMDVYDVPEMSTQLRVDANGDVTIPLVGKVHVGGETVPEAQNTIAAILIKHEILKSPQVTLNILQYLAQSVTVLGEVQSPGRIQILNSEPLENILALAGGESIAAGNEIEIQHTGKDGVLESRQVHYAQGNDPRILRSEYVDPGDTVFVHRAGIIYVLGAVNRPGGYLMVNGGTLDVIQAVSLAGGTTLQASTKSAVIVRRQGAGFVQFKVPLEKIEKGKATPVRLELNDALFVPTSSWKTVFVNSSNLIGSIGAAALYRAP